MLQKNELDSWSKPTCALDYRTIRPITYPLGTRDIHMCVPYALDLKLLSPWILMLVSFPWSLVWSLVTSKRRFVSWVDLLPALCTICMTLYIGSTLCIVTQCIFIYVFFDFLQFYLFHTINVHFCLLLID